MFYTSQNQGRPLGRASIVAFLAALAAAALPGCSWFHRFEAKAAVIAPLPAPAQHADAMLPVDLTKVQPNEAGLVPVIMFHNIKGSVLNPAKLIYPVQMFRQDIQWLYDHNYRPISLTQFVQGKIDCPAGMTPVILTFDDALRSQFNFTADGQIDPNCAVGVLEAFHAAHPDWPLRGTFFVLTDEDPKLPPPFYQKEYAQGKLEHLVQDGFDIGNHTVHHRHMNHLSDSEVVSELAGAVAGIHRYVPDYDVDTLALPYGDFPKNRSLLVSGEAGGVSYHNLCAMAAAYRPTPSPMCKNFTPYHIERIRVGVNENESRYWLNWLVNHKSERFISDGDVNTYTINAMSIGLIDKARLEKLHFHLRTYNGTQMVASN
jgi:peptidoglycan/xylan/chitin deacetylase (PgdA/CDA1 family)